MFHTSLLTRLRNDFLKEYRNGEIIKAIQTGEKMLDTYKTNNIPESLRYAQDLYNLARSYQQNLRLEKAIATYEDAKNMIEYITEDNQSYPQCLIDIYTNMAIIYRIMDKNDMALACFEKAYSTCKDTFNDSHPEFVKVNYNMGSMYYDLKSFNEALYYYSEALEVASEKTNTYYDILNSMGYCYEKLKDYTQAQRMFEKALSAIADLKEMNSEEYLSNINYMSNMLLRVKKYDDALVWFKKTAAITKATFSEEHPLYAEVLSKLGDTHDAKKEYDKAIMFKTKALNIAMKNGNNLNQLTILLQLAQLYKKTNQPLKAAATLKKCLNIKKELLSSDNISYIKESIELADLYMEMDKIKDSAAVLEPLLENKKLTPLLCQEISKRLIPIYENLGDGNQLYALYDAYVRFFPDKSFDDMLNIAENK